MAKSKNKDKASKKALSGGSLFSQEAVSQFLLNRSGRLPDMDETLRKAGIARNRLSVVLEDDEVAQTSETRLDALLGQPYRLEPSDAPETKYLQQEINQWFSAIATCGLDALWYGYSVQEAVYEEKDGYLGFKEVKQKPLQWFEPKNDGRLIYRQDCGGLEQEVDQSFKFFLTIRKATYENPYGKPLLSTLYWLWFFKQNGFKFWAKCLERFGTPILLGKADSSEPQEMLEALLNAHAQSVISIDTEDDVQVLNSAGGGSQGQAFDLFNNAIIRQIQKVVLGQTLTSGNDGGGGSRALGEVHENVRKDKLKSDIRLITPTFQTVVNALCQLNGWQYHKIIIGDERSLNTDQAKRDEILSRTGLTFSKDYFMSTYGLKETDIVDTKQIEPTQTQFTAITPKAYQFTANNHLSPEQQQVEQITDQQPPMQLLPQNKITELVQTSASPQELTQHLIGLLPDVSQQTFTANLDRALFTADVLGFVHSAKE